MNGVRIGRDTFAAVLDGDLVFASGLRIGAGGFLSVSKEWREYGVKATVRLRFCSSCTRAVAWAAPRVGDSVLSTVLPAPPRVRDGTAPPPWARPAIRGDRRRVASVPRM